MSADADIAYTVTWLEMTARPDRPRPPTPAGGGLSLLRAENPPVHFFRYLYDTVGRDYHWTDMHAVADEEVAAFVQDPAVRLFVLYRQGWPAGFIMLDDRHPPVCDISYFGMLPEVVGRGLGAWLLGAGIHMAWDGGCERLTVNTCTLDHPRALPAYQRWGFTPVRREARRKSLA